MSHPPLSSFPAYRSGAFDYLDETESMSAYDRLVDGQDIGDDILDAGDGYLRLVTAGEAPEPVPGAGPWENRGEASHGPAKTFWRAKKVGGGS